MHPIAFVLEVGGGSRPIGTFGLCLALAIVVGGAFGIRAAVRVGISHDDAVTAAAVVSAVGLVGGYVLDLVARTLSEGFGSGPLSGGLTFYGAPIFGSLALATTARSLRFSALRLSDAGIAAVPIAHGIGRIGCFLAGCCHGRPGGGPFAVVFDDPYTACELPYVPVHPTQLYEALGLFVLAGIFTWRPADEVGTGRRTAAYAALYAALRLGVERFRGDAVRGVYGGVVSTSDVLSLLLLAASIAFLWTRRRPSPGAALSP